MQGATVRTAMMKNHQKHGNFQGHFAGDKKSAKKGIHSTVHKKQYFHTGLYKQ